MGSGIEWTDTTWNPIVGCSVVSPGCTNCYAMRLAGTRLKDVPKYHGLTRPSKAGPVWTGQWRFVEEALEQPLGWRRPRRVFVNSMSDLFGEGVEDWWIDRVFAVMACCPQHRFQVLTKRAERMRDYLNAEDIGLRVDAMVWSIVEERVDPHARRRDDIRAVAYDADEDWPLPNVEIGVSAEDQQRADERIPYLLQASAALRFVSCEPLLGPIDLCPFDTLGVGLDWVIVGGESGPGARPMDLTWARAIKDTRQAEGVPVFVKQLGRECIMNGLPWRPGDRKGADMDEWPEDLRVREMPRA